MTTSLSLLWVLATIAVVGPVLAAQDQDVASGPPEEVTVEPAEVLESLHHELYEQVYDERIGCLSVLVARDGEVLWEQGFGWADARAKRPASSSTIYPVASVSKSLVGLATALLVAEGLLDLEAPVAEVLTSFDVATGSWVEGELRVRDLAQMTAGMPHGGMTWLRQVPATAREGSLAAVRAFAVVDEEPGRDFRYSNYTSGVLEAVVQDVSGESLEGFLRRRVFDPLGMTGTRALPAAEDPRMVRVRSNSHVFEVAPFMTPSGGLGFYSSVKDIALLAQLHLDSKRCAELDLDPAAIASSRSEPGDRPVGPAAYWMGWGRFATQDATFEMTNGQGFDATSCLILCPERRAVAICLTDTQWWGTARGGERVADVVALRAMDAVIRGCKEAFETARERHETEGASARARTPGEPLPTGGNWTGTLRLAGVEHDAKLTLGPGGSVTLSFGEIVAKGQVQEIEGRLEGSLTSTGKLTFFGETSELSEVSIRLTAIDRDRLAGSAILAAFADERVVVGSGGALVEFSR